MAVAVAVVAAVAVEVVAAAATFIVVVVVATTQYTIYYKALFQRELQRERYDNENMPV